MADDLLDAPWMSDAGTDLADAPWAAESPPGSLVENALKPVTSYPETYAHMNREAREQVSHGVGQLTSPESSAWERTKGAGNVALGSVGYALSPINAGLRTVVGEPVEAVTGIPKEYTEFAAGLALPGVGMTRLPAAGTNAAVVPTAQAIKASASAAYKSPEVAALQLHPAVMPYFGNGTINALTRQGFDPLLAPKTFGLLEKAMDVPAGTPHVTARNFETLRRMLGKAAGSADKTEREAARLAQGQLDDFMANIPSPAVLAGDADAAAAKLAEARGNWASASRSASFQGALEQAERQAARAGVGGNIENATRQRITSILNSPAKRRGFSTEEVEALEGYVQGNFTRNSLRVATKVLGGDNPLMAAIHAGLAWPTSGLSLAAPLTGYVLKRINNSMSVRELSAIDELLRSRSPLAREAQQAVVQWSRAGAQMSLDPNARSAARLAMSANFLAERLNTAGIKLDPSKLIGSFQSPGSSTAEESENDIPRPPGQQKNGGRIGHQNNFANGGRVDPDNIHSSPSEGQKEAGNYAKDHVRIHGMDIAIENAKGSKRSGVDRGGKKWSVTMPAHYGYLKGTLGKDKDHVDVYLGPHTKAPKVYVVDQRDPDTKKFDEHKCFIGFASAAQARKCYISAFSDGRGLDRMGAIYETSVDGFKHWLAHGDTTKPAAAAA